MAFFSPSSSSLQIVLISFGVIFAAVILKLSFPVLTEFVVSDLPFIWNSITTWFKPPYLYVVINCIIVTLIASSKFQQNGSDNADNVNVPLLLLRPPADHISPDDEDDVGAVNIVETDASMEVTDVVKRTFPVDLASVVGIDTDIIEGAHMEMIAIAANSAKDEEDENILFYDLKMDAAQMEMTDMAADAAEEEEKSGFDESAVLSLQSWNSAGRSVWDEKPPRSNRFSHRKPNKSNIDGGRSCSSLRVSKPKRYETLDSTWKAITEGRAMPLGRHKRKSETWQDEDRRNLGTDNSETCYKYLKEEGKPSSSLRRNGKLKREASPGQDDLNRRVEAFIKKFNEEMRLQRQRSLQQYKDMMRINAGGGGGGGTTNS